MQESDFSEFTYDGDATYFDSAKDSAAYSYQMRKQCSGGASENLVALYCLLTQDPSSEVVELCFS